MEALNLIKMNISKNFKNLWDVLGNLSLIHWLILSLLFLGPLIFNFYRFITFQLTFAKNLKRKVYFLKTYSNQDLQSEKDQISRIGIFQIEQDVKSIEKNLKALQNISESSVLVVSYHKSFKYFKGLFEFATQRCIPVIIFAKQGEIKDPSHWNIFNSYIYCDVVNYPNRLAIILLNTLMILRKP